MIELTKHFVENWEKRVGGIPTPETIHEVIRQSVRVQHCADFVLADGSRFRMLATYWHPDLSLILRVDNIEGKAVSVLSDECLRKPAKRRIRK